MAPRYNNKRMAMWRICFTQWVRTHAITARGAPPEGKAVS